VPSFTPRNTARAKRLRNEATPAERKLWPYLAKSALGAKFSRQMPVGPYYADFLCREWKLVVELDGFSHDVQPVRDEARNADLRSHGYTVLHFANEDVLDNAEGIATAIQLKIAELRAKK
jgi:BirA family biotin operon repressor/biotin-[acetyl-CoA-carboxylase] ligase